MIKLLFRRIPLALCLIENFEDFVDVLQRSLQFGLNLAGQFDGLPDGSWRASRRRFKALGWRTLLLARTAAAPAPATTTTAPTAASTATTTEAPSTIALRAGTATRRRRR